MRGFKIAGKRGSKFFVPCKEDVLETEERERSLRARMLASVAANGKSSGVKSGQENVNQNNNNSRSSKNRGNKQGKQANNS